MTDWNAWAHVVDAAQDPRRRDSVQRFLAQTDLSADIPAALDDKFLVPGRSSGATGEQCANLVCNLGFAALVSGSKESAEFAIACGHVAERHAQDDPDLELRRLFLSSKAASVLALLANQPHLLWGEAIESCAAYLGAIDNHLESLPEASVESNAMAAFSFSSQLLQRIRALGAADYHASEVSQLISVALGLAGRLPAVSMARLWSAVLPGTDARVLFRQMGAAAEQSLQRGAESNEHATKGIDYTDDILSGPGDLSDAERGEVMQCRAELLLLVGRESEAMEIARNLDASSNEVDRKRSTVITARQHLLDGDPKTMAALLGELAPGPDEVVDDWCRTWIGETDGGHWTTVDGSPSRTFRDREIWGLQVLAVAESNDPAGVVATADRFGGFLADSFMTDRAEWAKRLAGSVGDQAADTSQPKQTTVIENVDPSDALREILERLGEKALLAQVAWTDDCLVTSFARWRDGGLSLSVVPAKRSACQLRIAHKAWSRARFDSLRSHRDRETEIAAAFRGMLDEVDGTWCDAFKEQLDDNVAQVVLVGDDLAGIPLHAMSIGNNGDRLIDRVPVSYAPSLHTLLNCLRSARPEDAIRTGIELAGFADPDVDAGDFDTIAAILQCESRDPVSSADPDILADLAACQVLHIGARTRHDGRLPLASILDAGEVKFSAAELLAELDLPRCELVSALNLEATLATMARAPGFDFTTLLLAAGARRVLASSWDASRELSSAMVRAFFDTWVQGQAPSAAFRQALRKVRSENPSLPDHHWAGFRLVGAP